MTTKELTTRIILKHDTESNWKNVEETFIPLVGEMIVYDPDETHSYSRFKIGDGVSTLVQLSFGLQDVGTDNTVYAENSFATGYKNIAGGKGFRIVAEPTGTIGGLGTYTLDSVEGIEVGMYYSVATTLARYHHGTVQSINTAANTVTVDNYPGHALNTNEDNLDGYVIYNFFLLDDYPELGTTVLGYNAQAFGYKTQAHNVDTHAEGRLTKALGKYGHAEGLQTIAGHAAHAEGMKGNALGSGSHAEGTETLASMDDAHAEGRLTKATASQSHAEGQETIASAHTAHAEGFKTKAGASHSHAEGHNTETESTAAYSHAEGNGSIVKSPAAHAEGQNTTVENNATAAHAEGASTVINVGAWTAHAEGSGTVVGAKAYAAHTEGSGTSIGGEYVNASGTTIAASHAAHAEGDNTTIGSKSYGSHAEGINTVISEGAHGAHVEGVGTKAVLWGSHVEGRYNAEDDKRRWLHIVGNGTSDTNRSNAHTIDTAGNAWFKGVIVLGGTSQSDAPDVVATMNNVKNYAAPITHIHEWSNDTFPGDLRIYCGNASELIS